MDQTKPNPQIFHLDPTVTPVKKDIIKEKALKHYKYNIALDIFLLI